MLPLRLSNSHTLIYDRAIKADSPIRLSSEDKLHVLRRLDRFRRWDSLADERYCIVCGKVISGRQVEVLGGTRGHGPLRLQCPTENCSAIPIDWILPDVQSRTDPLGLRALIRSMADSG